MGMSLSSIPKALGNAAPSSRCQNHKAPSLISPALPHAPAPLSLFISSFLPLILPSLSLPPGIRGGRGGRTEPSGGGAVDGHKIGGGGKNKKEGESDGSEGKRLREKERETSCSAPSPHSLLPPPPPPPPSTTTGCGAPAPRPRWFFRPSSLFLPLVAHK